MNNLNSLGRRAGRVVAGALTLGVVLAGFTPAYADVAAPATADMGKIYIGSGSDTTYDMMKAIDKLYAGANGCASIWVTGQPKSGACDPATAATGNDVTTYPWVNATHDTIVEQYPVGSGNGALELCNQGRAATRNVDFGRSSGSNSTTAPKCTDLMYVGYAKDAVSWWHATAKQDGTPSASADIKDISKAVLGNIYKAATGYTVWSDLNNNAGVLDANGAQLTTLPSTPIKVYTAQAGSGTVDFWRGSSGVNVTVASSAISTGQENNPAKIFADGNEDGAIYFMSVGRYKQMANITGTNAYSGSSVAAIYPLAADALGKIDGVEPVPAKLIASVGSFPLARTVYNVLRYPSAQILKYLGPEGFLCSESVGAVKDRVTGETYKTLRERAIVNEGFVPLPKAATGGAYFNNYAADTVAGFADSYCRVQEITTGIQKDVSGPTVGVTALDGLGSNGTPTGGIFNLSFDAVTSVDTTKLGIKSNGAYVPATYTCYNMVGTAVNCAGDANAPYAAAVINTIKVVPNSPLTGGSTVRYAADAGFGSDRQRNASVALDSASFDVAVPKTTAAIAWTADANAVIFNQSGSYDYDLSQLVNVTGTDATATYSVDTTGNGAATASVSGHTLSVTAAGTISVTVAVAETATAAAATVTRSFVLNGGAASFNWIPAANASVGSVPSSGGTKTIALADLGSPSASGATVNLSVIGGTASASVSEDRQSIVVTTPGTVTISVDVAATNTTAASTAARTVTIDNGGTTSFTWTPAADALVGTLGADGSAKTITAADLGSPSAGAQVTLAVTGGTASATVTNNSVVVASPGTVTITVNVSATSTKAASTATRTVTVGKATPVVTWKKAANAKIVRAGQVISLNDLITVPAGAGAQTWTITGTAKYTKVVSGGVTFLSVTKAGTLKLQVALAANANFNAVAKSAVKSYVASIKAIKK